MVPPTALRVRRPERFAIAPQRCGYHPRDRGDALPTLLADRPRRLVRRGHRPAAEHLCAPAGPRRARGAARADVNAYPLFVEPIPASGAGFNGGLFDLSGGYRPLFLLMAGYPALAFLAVLCVPREAGEADTGLVPVRPAATAH